MASLLWCRAYPVAEQGRSGMVGELCRACWMVNQVQHDVEVQHGQESCAAIVIPGLTRNPGKIDNRQSTKS